MAAHRGRGTRELTDDVFYSIDSSSFIATHDLNEILETASDLLIYREFESCLSHCSGAIDKIKNTLRFRTYVDSLCIVMIQAQAELNQWDDVLPLIQHVYGSAEDCPAKIIQMCLMLHVRVKEYIRCHAVAKLWLQNDKNRHKIGYTDVAKVYVNQVLVPLGALNLIPQFVESCSGLSDDDKHLLLSPMKTSEPSCQFSKSGETTHADGEDREKAVEKKQNEQKRNATCVYLMMSLQQVRCRILRFVAQLHVTPACRLLILVTLAAVALVNSFNSDPVTGYSRLVQMWMSLPKSWSFSGSRKPG